MIHVKKKCKPSLLVPLALVATSACGADAPNADDVKSTEQSIVRATANGGPEQVMMLKLKRLIGNSLYDSYCSGTLIAPRVVLTAAHCLENIWNNQVFAYWGDDYPTDLAQLSVQGQTLIPPATDDPSSLWAQGESYLIHPEYDPFFNHVDMGLVFLDRAPPMAPLPLTHFQVGGWLEGSTVKISGWGGSEALTADISQVIGGQVQRTGYSTLLGSPTEADFHEDDPNYSMLVPEFRAEQLKIDGSAPNSNTCAGDSGSPLLINQGGGDMVAGVSYWGGLWCEDYGLFARTYPQEQSFINPSLLLGGSKPIQGTVECVRPLGDGKTRAYIGYDNQNLVSLDVPTGDWRNSMFWDDDGLRPTHFEPGEHPVAMTVDIPQYQTEVWQIVPPNGWGTSLVVNQWTAPACGEEDQATVECADNCRARALVGCDDTPSFDTCVDDCLFFGSLVPECIAELSDLLACEVNVPAEEWICYPGLLYTPSCIDQEDMLFACIFGGF